MDDETPDLWENENDLQSSDNDETSQQGECFFVFFVCHSVAQTQSKH